METIQVVLDRTLLRAADRAARKLKTNRSALFREALRARYPDALDEPAVWDKVADWPED